MAPPLYLMPGMDGTGELFAPLLAELTDIETHVVSYPRTLEGPLDAFVESAAEQIDTTRPYVLLAESFSGPIALRLLDRHGAACRGFLACATFISDPSPVWSFLARLPCATWVLPKRSPAMFIRSWMLDADADDELVERVRAVIASVPRRTHIRRMRLIGALDEPMYDFDFPVHYLRGTGDRMVGGLSDADFVISVPGTRSREIDGPHLLAQARPQAVAEAIRTLIRRAEDPARDERTPSEELADGLRDRLLGGGTSDEQPAG